MDRGGITEAIVLAGGFGTRLRTVLKDVPKILAPVRGVAFVHYILSWLENQGVERVVASTGYLADQVAAELRRYPGRLLIECVREQTPLGTGGAIYRGLREIRGEHAFALNGDTYFPGDLAVLQAAARRLDAPLAVALRRLEDTSRYGAVEVRDGRIVGFHEKGRSGPGLLNAGLYLLPRDLWRTVPMPDVFSWELDFLQPLAPKLLMAGVVLDAPFLDIGTPESYARAEGVLPQLADL
ncbi:MAG: nucleotidyltransferase family protein [Bryobacteraceae bacterium]